MKKYTPKFALIVIGLAVVFAGCVFLMFRG